MLMADAEARLAEVAQRLGSAGVPTLTARLRHKDRGNWVWPAGRQRQPGWLLTCGDAVVLLTPEGWLTAAHRCNDPAGTVCACPLTAAEGPLPPGVEVREPFEGDNKARSLVVVRTECNGATQELAFNRWLAEQVLDLLPRDT